MKHDAFWQFWQDRQSGEVWAVVVERAGAVVGSCGPFAASQADTTLLPYLPYVRRDVAWLERHRHQFSPLASDAPAAAA